MIPKQKVGRVITYKDERDEREYPPPFTSTPNCNSTHRSTEHKLKLAEQDGGNSPNGISKNTSVEGILEIPNNTRTFPIGEGIADYKPLNRTA